MKKILRRVLVGIGVVLLVLVLLVVGVVLARDGIATSIIKKAVAKTGFGLELKNLHLGLSPLGVEVEGLKLTNPPDFPEVGALEINKLKVSYDRKVSTKEEARLPEVTFDLPSLTIVRKADGEVNFQRLGKKAKGQQPATGSEAEPQPKPQPPKEKKPEQKIRIDKLNIRLGTILIRTYTQGQKEPEEKKFVMNVDKQYTDVTNESFKKIIADISMEILFKSPDTLKQLGEGLTNAAGGGAKNAKEAGKKLQEQFKGLFNSLKQQQPTK
ncbi:MAG: AsmA family protein [Kiritimatiellaeota bacterium]|nr:AsmA family protein [Kiritimatiellota bacterium]